MRRCLSLRHRVLLFLGLLGLGGPALAQLPARDLVSDAVGATAGTFRVDQSGNAIYEIAIATVPGTAGVAPQIALTYSSQGGMTPLGQGWSLSGQSTIARCRKTREAGDFISGTTPMDGDSAPVAFSNADVFCLDGQRLLLVSGAYGASGAEYRPETDPWTRVTSLGGNNSTTHSQYTGPLSFRVERKDGSVSEYGNTVDSRVERNACGGPACAIAGLGLNKVQDSTGNYLTWHYQKLLDGVASTNGLGADEFVVSEIRYTGKDTLPGQVSSTSAPYARVLFGYSTLPLDQRQGGWQSGSRYSQSQRLDWIKVQDPYTGTPRTLRYYQLNQTTSISNSNLRVLASVQECNRGPSDSGVDAAQVCYPATTFEQSAAKYDFETVSTTTVNQPTNNRHGSLLGDVDGDGRQDIVWIQDVNEGFGGCTRSRVFVSYGDYVPVGSTTGMTLATPAQTGHCVDRRLEDLENSWHLLDYDGDGRDDLMVASSVSPTGRWSIHLSTGRPQSGSQRAFASEDALGDILIPVTDSASYLAELADFNGDGLLDVLYPATVDTPNGPQSELRTRLRVRVADPGVPGQYKLVFGPPSTDMAVDFAAADPCPNTPMTPFPGYHLIECNYGFAERAAIADFDGDGRSDVLMHLLRVYQPNVNNSPPPPVRSRFVSAEELTQLRNAPSGVGQTDYTEHWYFFTVRGQGNTTRLVQFDQRQVYKSFGLGAGSGSLPSNPAHLRMADVNGDSLPDVVFRSPNLPDYWAVISNTGRGFNPGQIGISDVKNEDYVQLADINGDGRADLLNPPSDSGCGGVTVPIDRPFCVRYGQPGVARFGAEVSTPGGGAASRTGSQDLVNFEHYFADFDGDGTVDYLRWHRSNNNSGLYASRSFTRHIPRDVITRITDGIGATTHISYAPMTNGAVYRRDNRSLLSPDTARGSPVHDLLAPMYLVSRARSSAPTWDNQNHLAEVSYRYAGAKLQAGGRGYLGFREMESFDGAYILTSPQHMVTKTNYRQDFPFVGMPLGTEIRVVGGAVSYGSAAINACRNDPEVAGQFCFQPWQAATQSEPAKVTPFPATSGIKISGANNYFTCQGTGDGSACIEPGIVELCPTPAVQSVDFNPLGTPQPLFTYLLGSSEFTFDPLSGGQLTHTDTGNCYADGFGNLTFSNIDRKDASGNLLANQKTQLSYDNDIAGWKLGRLRTTLVTQERGGVSKTRVSDFGYELTGSGYTSPTNTGLLKAERLQSGLGVGQDLRTLYTLDAWGNRTHAFQCSALNVDGTALTDAQCVDVTRIEQRPLGATGPTTAVHRYTRQQFGSGGRYLIASYAPFYSPTAPRNVVELPTLLVDARDEFGNVVQARDANGVTSYTRFGALGRPYASADQSGAAMSTTYRWCSQVACPVGAAYRSQTTSATAATTWTYFDRLGRNLLNVGATFEAGVSDRDLSAVCTFYDGKGRPERVSAPFFLPGVSSGGAPTFASDPCTSRDWATSRFDVIGRMDRATEPDGTETLTTYTGLTTDVTNAKGQRSRSLKNALGETVQTFQADPTTPSVLGLGITTAYDADGQVATLTRDAGQGEIVTRYFYDTLGRLTETRDPDRGLETREYNAAGEVISTLDASQRRVQVDFDALGRVWRRVSRQPGEVAAVPAGQVFKSGFEGITVGGTTTDVWTFDTAVKGLGQLQTESRTSTNTPTYSRTVGYDSLARPSTRATLIDGQTYSEGWQYDAVGRPYRETDASGQTLERTFTARGHLHTVRDLATGQVYQRIDEVNARGQVTRSLQGSVNVTRGFESRRGWLKTIQSGSGNNLQNLSYDHDVLGNVEHRRDFRVNQVESFGLDGLNRLTSASVTLPGFAPVTTMSLSYDLLGNICSKDGSVYRTLGRDGCDGVGVDGNASPHAVNSIGSMSLEYESSGDLLVTTGDPVGNRVFGYTALGQLATVSVGSGGNTFLDLRYTPTGERYRRAETVAGSSTLTRTVGSVEFITRPTGVIETKRYIAGVLIETRFSNTSPTTQHFLFTDGLGSVDVLADVNGGVIERLSFDPHGRRRQATDWRSLLLSYSATNTTRGYTGHEQLDPFGLIHMNGRVYDPRIGRFIQADPVTDIGIQGLNRYSYVLNNPLSLTDPSGHSSWGQILRTIVAIVITYYTGGAASTLFAQGATAQAFGVAVAGGFAAGAVQSGTLKGGVYGAFSAALFFGVGSAFEGAKFMKAGSTRELTSIARVAKTVAHGITGGTMSTLQGGKFGHGFLSAGVTEAVSPHIGNIKSVPGQVVAAAVLGGSVSAATGGKFANGALTAAFSRAFNHLAHAAAAAKFREEANITFSGEGAERLETNFNSLWDSSASFRGSVMVAHERWGGLEYVGVYGDGTGSYSEKGGKVLIDLNSPEVYIGTKWDGAYRDSRAAEAHARYQRLSIARAIFHETLHLAFSKDWGLRSFFRADDDSYILPIENRMVRAEGLFGGRERTSHNDWLTKEHFEDYSDGYR